MTREQIAEAQADLGFGRCKGAGRRKRRYGAVVTARRWPATWPPAL